MVSEGGKYVDGSIFVDGFFRDSPSPRIKRFVQEFSNTFDSDSTTLEAQAYDAVDLCVQVLTNQEIYSHRQMRDGLMGVMGFDGISGLTSFGLDGKPNKIPFILTVRKGEIQQIE